MRDIDALKIINPNHKDFILYNQDDTVLFYGGAGSGKSYSTADKLLLRSTNEDNLKGLVVRKSLPSIRRTCMPLMEQRAKQLHLPYSLNKTEFIATVNNDMLVYYLSMNHKDDYEKIKSITDVDWIWIEEANELSEFAYEMLDMRLRGGLGDFAQLIMTFNPIGTTSWLYDKFFVRKEPCTSLHSVVYDNPFIEKRYVKKLEALEKTNPNLYKVYCLGEWGRLEGVIYANWDIVHIFSSAIDERIYGLDFGYNNPTALVEINIADTEFYLQQKIYQTHMTNSDLIRRLKRLKIDSNDPIYCDSSEPDRIEEICQAGFNAKPADKEVLSGIDFVQAQSLHVLESSDNWIKEANSYVWEVDKDNNPLDRPTKFNDHLMDATRYGIYTHCKKEVEARVRVI